MMVHQSLFHWFLRGRKRNLRLCSICQNLKDSKGCDKLTSTGNGNIIIASRLLQDNYLIDITDTELKYIEYHVTVMFHSRSQLSIFLILLNTSYLYKFIRPMNYTISNNCLKILLLVPLRGYINPPISSTRWIYKSSS